jgi:hypothetical protein
MRRVLMVLVLVSLSGSAFAWGNPGHEIIARVAQDRLSNGVEDKVIALLRSCDPARTNMVEVATLPDDFRNHEGAQITRSWHFVNIDIANADYLESRDCPLGDCVVRRIDRAVEMLRNDEEQFTRCERKDALIYLIHFVGDLHQPFHCGFGRFADRTRDRGGNSVQVRLGQSATTTNLHSAWDGLLGQRRTQDQWVTRLEEEIIPSLDPALVSETSTAAWADESHDIAISEHPRPANASIVSKLDQNYLDRNRPVIDERLALAAVRLANLITNALQ